MEHSIIIEEYNVYVNEDKGEVVVFETEKGDPVFKRVANSLSAGAEVEAKNVNQDISLLFMGGSILVREVPANALDAFNKDYRLGLGLIVGEEVSVYWVKT